MCLVGVGHRGEPQRSQTSKQFSLPSGGPVRQLRAALVKWAGGWCRSKSRVNPKGVSAPPDPCVASARPSRTATHDCPASAAARAGSAAASAQRARDDRSSDSGRDSLANQDSSFRVPGVPIPLSTRPPYVRVRSRATTMIQLSRDDRPRVERGMVD